MSTASPDPSPGSGRNALRLYALLLLASLAVRLAAWAYFGTGTIESEGAEYARIAQNLRSGVGYVGLVAAGPQVLFPPLYPLLIAAVSYLTNDFELAGRLVSLAFGSALPLFTFAISSRLFDRRVGLLSAALTLAHPLPVYLSFVVYSEGPYATLLLSVMYFGLRALGAQSAKSWMHVGAACALSYLMRPEGFALFSISAMFAVLATTGRVPARLKALACLASLFLVLALPQVAFLRKATGRITFETKSVVLFSYTGGRVLAADTKPGQDFELGGLHDVPSAEPDEPGGYPARWQDKWATFGVNSRFEETGLSLRPFADIARGAKLPFSSVVALLKKGLGLNGPMFFKRLSARWIGPLLPLMAVLGLLRKPWRNQVGRLYVAILSAAPLAATFFVLWNDDRYYFIFVPLCCVWAGNGISEAGILARALAERLGLARLSPGAVSHVAVPLGAAALIIVSPARAVAFNYQFTDSGPYHRAERQLAEWLGQQKQPPGRILDLILPFSYHAGATKHVFPPYCTEEQALSYLDAAQVDYVVLRPGRKLMRWYTEWATRGIPDERAERLTLPAIEGGERLVIYRWHRSGSDLDALKPPASTPEKSRERGARERPFFTRFGSAESPLLGGGAWSQRDPAFGRVSAFAGLAFATEDARLGSKAYLSNFPPRQLATAVIHKSGPAALGLDVQLLLRWSDSTSANSAAGYTCTLQGDERLLIARFGASQPFFDSKLSASLLPALGVHDRDVFSAQIIGNTITVRLNGTLIASATDPNGAIPAGNPGIGFSQRERGDVDRTSFCFSSFTAQAL